MTLAVVNAIWIGSKMGPIHAACLGSFLTKGHRVVLHCYEAPKDAPAGIEYFDARELMPRDAVVRHHRWGSLALASDIYRYRILRAGLGLYVDCDVYCIRPVEDAEYLFGWASGDNLASAVLKFPASSPVVDDLCAAADDPFFIAPWSTPMRRTYLLARKHLGIPVHISRQRWGTIGPRAVTWYVAKRGLIGHAQPREVFSPIAPTAHQRLFEADLSIEALITPHTLAVHLFHEKIRRSARPIPPTSPLGRILAVKL